MSLTLLLLHSSRSAWKRRAEFGVSFFDYVPVLNDLATYIGTRMMIAISILNPRRQLELCVMVLLI